MRDKTLKKHNISLKWTLISILYLATAANGLNIVSLPQNIPNLKMVSVEDRTSFVNPGLAYGSCSYKEEESKQNCTIFIETKSNVNSAQHLRSCNISYDTQILDEDGKLPIYLHRSFFLDENKVALIWWTGGSSEKLSILHFFDCKHVPVELGNVTRMTPMAPFNGNFDVALLQENSSNYLRAVVDFDGSIVQKKEDWIRKNVYEPITIVRSPLKERLVVFVGRYSNVDICSINDEGHTELIKSYPFDDYSKNKDKKSHSHYVAMTSATHELLTVCTEKNLTSIICGQFDLNGVLKFETNFTFLGTEKLNVFNVHNLPGGGFLFLNFKCPDKRAHWCHFKSNNKITVKKVDATGREVGTLHLLQIGNIPQIHFFENEKKEMCLSAVNEVKDSDGATVDVACFKDEDFIQ